MAAPRYLLHCRTGEGDKVELTYSPHTGELTDAAGRPLLADVQPRDFEQAHAISPTSPGRKSREVATLKIQLGMRCNYSCSYCNQASAAPDATVTRTADAQAFVTGLDTWLQGEPERIEFWGGEPLLYFAKLQRLVPALRERFPRATCAMVTNGSLLDEDILEFIERFDLQVAVSHDGPGHHLRGPDPFQDPARAHWLRQLWRRRGGRRGRVTFNVVLTPRNADIGATRAWLASQLGDEEIALDTEGVVSVYDEGTLRGAGHWTAQDYQRLRASIVDGFASGAALRYLSIRQKAKDFILSLQQQRPASALGQKCGMDLPGELAVDLQGNVMTCQNTGARGKHRIGHVSRLDEVALTTATHWSHRDACRHCPVLQLCKGGCMYQEDEHFAQSCENEYHYNLAVLEGVLWKLAGLRLEKVTGDIRRARPRRRIPITSVAPA